MQYEYIQTSIFEQHVLTTLLPSAQPAVTLADIRVRMSVIQSVGSSLAVLDMENL